MALKKITSLIIAGLATSSLVFSQTNTPCSSGSPAATVLTVNSSCSYTSGTTVGATYQSNANNGGTPSCASPGAPDVWYMFTAPASGSVTIDLQAGTITDSGMALYSGTCGSWTQIACDDDGGSGSMSQISSSSLTPGQTYLIRIWEYSSGTGTFGICVTDNGGGGGSVSNDDPCSATPVTADVTCSYSSYTTAGATDTGLSDPGCANFSGGDVWFSVTVPASGNLVFDTNTGVVTDGGMAIYSGTCSSLTLIDCDDDNSSNGLMPMISQPGLTPGSTVWIQFWEYGNDNPGTFSLCVYEGATGSTPANDDPCNATAISVGATCNFSTYTNDGATDSGLPDPGCSWYDGGDVWFEVTVPASGALAFDSNTGVISDGGMAIYSGTCGSLTLIDCDDDGSTNGAMPYISNGSLTPGSTIWIQFWEYGNDNQGTFDLCVYETTPPPPPPANVTCSGMNPICSDTPITFTASTGGADAEIVDPGNNYGCLSTSPNPTWYYLQLQSGGTISIDMSAGSDIDFAMWGPFANLATAQANCNSYGTPIDCSYSTSATEQANFSGAVANQVYVLLVTNYADVTQVIDLNSATGNTALTDCSIVLPVELFEFTVAINSTSNILHWVTLSENACDYFQLERSYDGVQFDSLTILQGHGNSSSVSEYEFSDRYFNQTQCYYRLKQVDFDGAYTYSQMIFANRDAEKVTFYPNPSSGELNLVFPSSCNGTYVVRFTDQMGKETVERLSISDHISTHSSSVFSSLPAGVYFVCVLDENGSVISREKVLKINP